MQERPIPRVKVPGTTDEDRSRLTQIKEWFGFRQRAGQLTAHKMHQRGPVYYKGTTPAHVVAKRRAKNKAARRARRANR